MDNAWHWRYFSPQVAVSWWCYARIVYGNLIVNCSEYYTNYPISTPWIQQLVKGGKVFDPCLTFALRYPVLYQLYSPPSMKGASWIQECLKQLTLFFKWWCVSITLTLNIALQVSHFFWRDEKGNLFWREEKWRRSYKQDSYLYSWKLQTTPTCCFKDKHVYVRRNPFQ